MFWALSSCCQISLTGRESESYISGLSKFEIRRKPNLYGLNHHSLPTQNSTKIHDAPTNNTETLLNQIRSRKTKQKTKKLSHTHKKSQNSFENGNTHKSEIRNGTSCSNKGLHCISCDIRSSRLPWLFHRSPPKL